MMSGTVIYGLANGCCPNCGGTIDTQPVLTGKCPYCGAILGHDKSLCQCENCQDARDLEFGLGALEKLKELKAKYPGASQPTRITIVNGQATKACSKCGVQNRVEANFCKNCGNRF